MPFRHNVSPDAPRVAFDPSRSCLENLTTGKVIYLSPAEGKLLQLLTEEKGSKQNIIYEIWEKNGTIVGESSYHQLVKMLRGKLNQAGLPKSVIKTVPRFGVVLMRDGLENGTAGLTAADNFSGNEHNGAPPVQLDPSQNAVLSPEYQPAGGKKNFSLYSLQLAVLITTIVLPFFYLSGVTGDKDAFPYKIKAGDVIYHYASSYVTGSQRPEDLAPSLGKHVRQVYVASNGPEVWIAKCTDTISDEGSECRFEHFSVY